MNNEFVTYEQAKALKELGFNEECLGVYGNHQDEFVFSVDTLKMCQVDNKLTLAPLLQQAFKWFIEKHGFFVKYQAPYKSLKETDWRADIKNMNRLFRDYTGHRYITASTYPEVEQLCLNKLIEIIKTPLI